MNTLLHLGKNKSIKDKIIAIYLLDIYHYQKNARFKEVMLSVTILYKFYLQLNLEFREGNELLVFSETQ